VAPLNLKTIGAKIGLILVVSILSIAAAQARPADDHLKLGKELLSTGKFPQASAEMTKAIELDGKLAEAYRLRGWISFWMGRPEQSIADLNLAVKLDPTVYDTFTARGEVLRQLSKYDDSRKDFDKAIKINPTKPDAYYLRGLSNLLQGLHVRAKKDFSDAIRLGAKNQYVMFAYYWRGRTAEMQEDYSAAIADFSESIKRAPFAPKRGAFRQIDPKAIYMYSAGESKTTALGLLERGLCYSQLGEHAKAIADLTEVLKSSPKETLLLEKRGHAYLGLGKYQEALRDYNKALLMGTESADVYFHLGIAHLCLKKYSNAASDLKAWTDRTFWEDDRKNPFAASIMYLAYKRSQQDAKAKQAADEAVKGMAKAVGWRKSVPQMLKGKITAEQLVALADAAPKKEKTQAHCYAALYLLAESKAKDAEKQLNWVATQGDRNMLEYTVCASETAPQNVTK